MTTDPFTDAARAEAERRWSRDLLGDDALPGPARMNRRIGFDLGAQWARTHLAAQEPTDAEVEAAARALAHWDGASGWGTPAWDGEITEAAYIYGAHMALLAARAARRDEKDKP